MRIIECQLTYCCLQKFVSSEIRLFFLRRCYNFHFRRLFRYYIIIHRIMKSPNVYVYYNYISKCSLSRAQIRNIKVTRKIDPRVARTHYLEFIKFLREILAADDSSNTSHHRTGAHSANSENCQEANTVTKAGGTELREIRFIVASSKPFRSRFSSV